ncbi:tRNA pseudouridine(55) synthase TruB [Metabacillus iocasae]|uniref:tRNA pseudouridine synthase B n=1 Tax=Priestia iocasae TaxID=2291674 RepID=A0ABS2QR36_9BACI|nr:tRNA pseudouridine(55) synthase TruB [Metabacillus iocasae]MBM7701909.1 tRNA pseudouridine55 synthase [Metabacillus iocasae]
MDGVLVLHKPKGMTSHDCVFKIRKLLRTKKVGHTGTLDPDVTGVLPICIGRATKIVEYLTGATKTYEGEVTIGFSTTTEDQSGEVVDQKEVTQIYTREDILEVLQSLTGEIEQTPPMYSAVKINGVRLYEYARKGIEIERPSRKVTIYQCELLDDRTEFQGETISFRFRVTCSKGTYIRTLAVMIGEKMGYPAHMSYLQRTGSGQFTLDDCLTFEEIEKAVEEGEIQSHLYPVEQALFHLPKLTINDTLAMKVKNGALLPCPSDVDVSKGPILMMDENGQCLAIYAQHPSKQHLIKPTKVLAI